MDHIINLIVRFFVFWSRFAPALSKLGLVEYRSADGAKDDPKLHILLAGYNGAGNTGSDVRVAEIARQLKERLGRENVEISVMTMDEETMRCYFDEDDHLVHCNAIFFRAVFRACCANQAAILCEGSTLKSKFANALTLYTSETAGIMKNQHKPCIAYGSEAGEMDAFLERTVRRLCKDTYFIARTQSSLDHIYSLGLKGHLGTDAAWAFDSKAYAEWARTQLLCSGWDGEVPLLGIAPINPFWWPVRPSLAKWVKAGVTGDHALQFRLWYFYTWSKQREAQFEAYLDAIALSVNEFAKEHACYVVLLGMEELDQDAVEKLQDRLDMPASVFCSSDYNGYEMAALLRQLSFLITSRYHALVLSMDAKVPSVAVSMDERLDNLLKEMGMSRSLLLDAGDPDLSSALTAALSFILSHGEQIREKAGQQLVHYQDTLDEMGDFLVQWMHAGEEAV